jgi:SM-20-related protein
VDLIANIASHGLGVVDNWLSSQELQDISRAFDQWIKDKRFTPAKIGKVENHILNTDIRGDETWWFDPLDPPFVLLPILNRINELRVQINRELFLGLKDWEAHIAIYPAGATYKKHLDRHRDSSHRKLSLILYLNENWSPDFGGELVIYRKNDEIMRVDPIGGRLVAFLSEDFPHEVLPATKPRRSLTGWFLDAARGVV